MKRKILLSVALLTFVLLSSMLLLRDTSLVGQPNRNSCWKRLGGGFRQRAQAN